MTPKDRRNRLFKDFKPVVRPLAVNGEIDPDDQKYLYAAYKEQGGELDDPQEVIANMITMMAEFDLAFFVDDQSKSFKKGHGPVGIVGAMYNGWEFQPHVTWLPWANKMNKLRAVVGILMYCRYNKDAGISIIKTLEDDRQFFKKLKKYAPIYGDYKIPHGDHRGDQYIFYVRGKKE